MKAGWQTKKLGELCRIRTGKKDVNQGNPEGEYPFFTCAAEHTYSDTFSFDTEALLIAGNGDVGKVSYYKGKFEAYQRTYVVSDFKDVQSRFLYLILDGKLKDTVSQQKLGNTMPYIKVGMLTDFPVPIPPLPEQQRIVGILDEAFDGIATAKANAEQNLQNARALFESHLQSVFTQRGEGWVEKTLGDVCEATQGVQIPKSEQLPTILPGYRRYLYISDFESNKNLKYVRDEHPKKLVTPDDIIVANTGSAGKIFRGIDGILSNNLFKVSFDPAMVDRDYIFFFVTSGLFREYQQSIMRGTANPHMGHVNFKSTPISTPSIEIQKAVVKKIHEFAEETQRLESLYQRKLAALDELKKSLLHQAFSGAL